MHLGWVTSSGRSTYIICGYMVFHAFSLCQLSLFYYSLDMETGVEVWAGNLADGEFLGPTTHCSIIKTQEQGHRLPLAHLLVDGQHLYF